MPTKLQKPFSLSCMQNFLYNWWQLVVRLTITDLFIKKVADEDRYDTTRFNNCI